MRTLHVNTSQGWRGGEQQVLYLLQGLAERGIAGELVAPGDGTLAARARVAGITVHPVSARGDLDLLSAWKLRGHYRRGFDLVHVHTGHAHALALLAGVGLADAPRLVVSRRVDFPIKGGKLGRLKYGRRVDRFIPISERVREVLVAGGVPEDQVCTVHSGVRIERFGVDAEPTLREELKLPQTARLVGFIGALVDHKAPDDLLTALAQLPAHVHAVLAGVGPLLPALRRQATSDALRGRVHFLGHRDDIPAVLRGLDLFCLPSRMEGLGTSVLDAMAAGTPVVASSGGGIPEMVDHGISGLLVPPGRPDLLCGALGAVLDDDELAARLVRGGRARVHDFSDQRMVEGTLRVYEDILGTSGIRPLERSWMPVGALAEARSTVNSVGSSFLTSNGTGKGVDAPS